MTIKTTSKALLGTAVSFALLSTASIANAADLDNLSDDDLLKRIERLEKIIGPGDNYAVRNANDKVRVSVTGQLNRLVLGFGDGTDFEVRNLDNTTSSSRFRIFGAAKLNENWTAGTAFEFEIGGEFSSAVTQDQISVANPNADLELNASSVRRAALFVKHKTYGRLLIGQFQTATDFNFHNDLSGTFIAGYSEVNLIGGGINFRTNGGANLTTFNISDATAGAGFDGGGRDDVIRYDTAAFAGFTGSASFTNGDEYAFNLGYKNKDLAGFNVDGDIGYTNFGDSTRDLISGSISAVHNATGLNGTFSYADDNDDQRAIYGKAGWKTKFFPVGKSHFVFEAGRFTNQNVTESILAVNAGDAGAANVVDTFTDFESQSTVLGGSFVQHIDAFALEAFIAYRNFSVDDIGAIEFEDINTITAGGRIKF